MGVGKMGRAEGRGEGGKEGSEGWAGKAKAKHTR